MKQTIRVDMPIRLLLAAQRKAARDGHDSLSAYVAHLIQHDKTSTDRRTA